MKRKTIISLLCLTMGLSIVACGKQENTAIVETTVESTEVENTVTEDSKVELLPWLQLSSLETHPELRSAFEELLGVTGTTGDKSGIIYINSGDITDQNNTLFTALGNDTFMNDYIRNEEQQSKIEEIANNEYTDIEDNQSIPAVINAYFELLPDQADGQFDGSATISRAQAMTLVMRATTPVNESQAPDEDADFTAKVGETQYTNFAAPMDEYAYLNTSTGLNDKTFESAMSKGEYIYLLANYYSQDFQEYMDNNGYKNNTYDEDVTISTVSDAGDISFSEAISDSSKGVPSDMYKAFQTAINMNLITESDLEDWDSAITKGEAVRLFTSMSLSYYQVAGVDSLADEVTENIVYPDVNPEDVDPKTTNMDGDTAFALGKKEGAEIDEKYGSEEAWTGYAQSQGADGTMGWCWVYYTGQGAGSEESYAVYMKEGSARYKEVFHLGDYLPGGTLFTGVNMEEMGIADNRVLIRKSNNGEIEGGTITQDEDGKIHIIVE